MLALEPPQERQELGAVEALSDEVLHAEGVLESAHAALLLHLALHGMPERLLHHDAVEVVEVGAVLLRPQEALEARLGYPVRKHAGEEQLLSLFGGDAACRRLAQQALRQQQPVERLTLDEVVEPDAVDDLGGSGPFADGGQQCFRPGRAALQRAAETLYRPVGRLVVGRSGHRRGAQRDGRFHGGYLPFRLRAFLPPPAARSACRRIHRGASGGTSTGAAGAAAERR